MAYPTSTTATLSRPNPVTSLFRPKCPDCGKRALVCRYEVSAEYTEVVPKYYQCDCCQARYARATFGPWVDASGDEYASCYATQ
jgi:hypothetical protein